MSAGTAAAPSARGLELTEELADLLGQLRVNRARAMELAGDVDLDALVWRPSPESWSIAQCLDHLIVTAEAYFPGIDAAIAKARARGWRGGPAYRRSRLGRWFIGLLEPPIRRRFQAPRKFLPANRQDADGVMERFQALENDFAARFELANGFNLWRPKLRSPALPVLRFSVAESFAILAAHERRHLAQIEAIRRSPHFAAL